MVGLRNDGLSESSTRAIVATDRWLRGEFASEVEIFAVPSFRGVARRLQLLVMLLLQVGDQAWCELRPRCDALA
jgi:hypothetical protein